MSGISVVVPVHNGATWLADVVAAIAHQASGRPFEILIVDDRSADDSKAIAETLSARWPVRVLEGRGRGAAAAINLGVQAARYGMICQIDQDVVVLDGWLDALLASLEDPTVAAAQGRYVAAEDASLPAQIAAWDLGQRYDLLRGRRTDHVCTGNTIYRAAALAAVGGLDESFGYGYDNDLSYRLTRAGFELAFVWDARSVHHWRQTLRGYCAQQYGQGYGRLQLVAKHPDRLAGDGVSRWPMMLHPAVMLAASAIGGVSAIAGLSQHAWAVSAALVALGLVAMLALERALVGAGIALRYRNAVPLLLPAFHLLRDLVWVTAIVVWCYRRIARARPRTTHSMRGRPPAPGSRTSQDSVPPTHAGRIFVLIPAHNESQALPQVIADVRAHCPAAELLVIDDGSSDDTARVADHEGVNWIRLPERMGVGSAMRAGLRYARRRRAGVVVRIDGDGQHRAEDISTIVSPVLEDRADVVLGSRYVSIDERRAGAVRMVQRVLGCCLSWLTGQPVTDPTSGFYALGPAAVRLLCDQHPTGYPEPELRLLLSRFKVRVLEMPMRTRARQGGRSSLTPFRLVSAGARVLLAMLIVPLRHAVDADHD